MGDQNITSEHETTPKSSLSWFRILAGLICVIPVYFASLGPLWGLKSRGTINLETYDSIAYPMLVIEMKTGFFSKNPIGKAYNDYIVWFGK